jgi:hypothetical protein
MTGQEFFEQVRSVFMDMAEKFSFSIVNRYEHVVELMNSNCTITFSYGRGETGCTFSDPKSGKETKYHAYLVYKKLYPTDDVFKDAPVYAPVSEMLGYYNELLVNRLQAVLLGDFSWSNDMDSENEMERKIKFVINNFPVDHPIKQKFWNGDLSWQQDLEDHTKRHSGLSARISNLFYKIFFFFRQNNAGTHRQ